MNSVINHHHTTFFTKSVDCSNELWVIIKLIGLMVTKINIALDS